MIEYLIILLSEIYKILFLLVPVLVSVAMIVWLDRRVWAFVQKRRGPNVVGPFGLLQSLADALKYIFKEIHKSSTIKFCMTWTKGWVVCKTYEFYIYILLIDI